MKKTKNEMSNYMKDLAQIIEWEMTEKKRKKLRNGTDLIMKSFIEKETITFSTFNEKKIIDTDEVKLMYNIEKRFLRIFIKGYKTFRKEKENETI
jgi:hypothetical protein